MTNENLEPGANGDLSRPLSIVVIGASGDLARKKIFPALFSLYSQGLLPENTHFYGLARSRMMDLEFRGKLTQNLVCRYTPEESCEGKQQDFLLKCFYHSGPYDSPDSFIELYHLMRMKEDERPANRLFYMAVPPFLFLDVANAIAGAGLVNCGDAVEGWSRVVVEKPFGKDRASSDALVGEMGQVFVEQQTYRIDHYLGKELIQNLMALRFANVIFEPVWSKDYIESVEISFKEDFGVEHRAGYFDEYGIIRDVMQNHLLQILALVAMEKPSAYNAHEIRDEKVRALRGVPPLTADNLVLGQYAAGDFQGESRRGYLEEPGVSDGSRTPTFAAAVLHVENERWKGVPFFLKAGKALDKHSAEIHIRFRPLSENIFPALPGPLPRNELVVRIQPDEGIYLRISNKLPGQKMVFAQRDLNLLYQKAFSQVLPEAYESLFLEVIAGDKSLFIRKDELEAAWDIFTPVLHEAEQRPILPLPYSFGSRGPEEADQLAARHGV